MGEHEQYMALIEATQKFVVVVENAMDIFEEALGEEAISMIKGPMGAVQSALATGPMPTMDSWDGVFRIEDCDIERFTPETAPGLDRIEAGVKLSHRPTGLAVETAQKRTYEDNLRVADRALRQRVAGRAKREGRAPR